MKKPLKSSVAWGLTANKLNTESTALFGTLARIFLAAGGHATLKADTLTTTAGAQGHAGQSWQWGGEFTICFGNNFVAHLWLQINNAKRY
jgi:hypothetical protein